MSNITELIQKLCPNGVEHVKLSHISRRLNEKNSGLKYNTVRAVTSSGRLVDPLTIFKDSVASEDKSNYLVVRKYNYIYNPARINIGSIAYSRDEKPVILSPMYIVFDLNKEKVLNEYFDYFIRSSEGKRQIISKVEEGARFRFPYESMEKLLLPLPPLVIQKEIVQILDQFKQLITELTTELTARKKQYEFYKNYLFNLNKDADIDELGNLCKFVRGPFGGSLKKEIFKNEGYAVYEQQHAIYGDFSFRYFISDEKFLEMKRFQVNPGDIIMSCSGTMGKVAIIPNDAKKGVINQALLKLTTNKRILNKYLKYFFESNVFWSYLNINTQGGAIKNVASVAILKTIPIPVPSLNEQQRIVDILDKFDKLVNDISEGLPAEIAARQKQYEYYRDKLLTFKEVGNESI